MTYQWITKLGGRRFLLCFWSVNISALLNYIGAVSGGELVLLFGGTVFVYVAGNGAQKWQEGKKQNDESIEQRAQD